MTNEEEKEIKRVCGDNYDESDVPAYMRKKDEVEWAEAHGARQDEEGNWVV